MESVEEKEEEAMDHKNDGNAAAASNYHSHLE